ncbi:chondroitinase family polysaccharide lyase [Paenibacillus sp. MBLB4367]|uniref:chondroitinase family polysaccharide lyase n=1 Tax=Paenibacillus sp. MBLB4367 TaxID=3384767 RepID=UPI0039080374
MTIYSFESGISDKLACDKASRLSISGRHYKDGNSSLRWDYEEGSFLTVKEPIGYVPFTEGAKSQARDSFAVWIYNPEPRRGKLAFAFGRGGDADCGFEFALDFQGWRTAWVAYERDMQGKPHPGMDTLTIRMPKEAGSGVLYIDQLMLNTPIDPRFHTRDFQVPAVNTGADVSANAHWLALYAYEQLEPQLPLPDAVTDEEMQAHKRMIERFEANFCKLDAAAQEDTARLRARYAGYDIVRDGSVIRGRPVALPFFDHYPKEEKERLLALTNSVQLSELSAFLLETAVCFRSSGQEAHKAELQAMFIGVLDHLDDQGWTYGSAQGTVHHFGYNFRDFYPAVLLMREPLRAAGRLERTQRAMRWYSGAGRIYTPLAEIEGNIDIFNTTLHGMLASLLVMDDTPDKVRELRAFRDWLGQSLLPAPGLRAAYKIDGSAYHHVNHYPAYAVGGFQGVAPVMYVLSGTPYRIGEQAHETIRKSLLAMRLYSNKREWPLSLASRHPTGKWALDPEPFAFLALSGTPDGTKAVDEEVAAAYLRLLEPGEASGAALRFEREGIVPEADPNGHWTMNYAALSIHRRGSWLAAMRGHSRYLWANETYVSANLYGRYISHGHLQIMSQGDPVNNEDSGYRQEGWDWNRWPGTTAVRKPIAELRSDVRNVDTFSGFEEMLLSDETYAGGLHLEGRNGMFAMKLHEHPKYEGSHRARKSAFFFEDRIVCLGTSIENGCGQYPTDTTLFQNHLPAPGDPIWVEGAAPVSEFPYFQKMQLDNPAWIMDNKGNGFYVAAGQTLSLSRSTQLSKHQATGADTEGDFAAAWLEHGVSPKDAGYEYAVLVGADPERMEGFCKRMQMPEAAAYTVLRKDRSAHVVRDEESRTIGYALFEASDCVDTGHIAAVDTPSIVMIRDAGDRLAVSAVDPDLRLYEGTESDQYDEHGVQKEVSVYSRSWVHAASIPRTMRLTLTGNWVLAESGNGEAVRVVNAAGEGAIVGVGATASKGESAATEASRRAGVRAAEAGAARTVVELVCKDAMPFEFVLARAAQTKE